MFAELGERDVDWNDGTPRRSFRSLGRSWLLRWPATACKGLIPQAVGEPGTRRTTAERALRFIAAKGQRSVVEAVARRFGSAVVHEVAVILSVDARHGSTRQLVPCLPAFWADESHPRPILKKSGLGLPDDAIDALARAMSISTLEIQDPVVEVAKKSCDARSLAEFAWSVFEECDGRQSRESEWVLPALAYFGDDRFANRLARRIASWSSTSRRTAAFAGIDTLLHMGTDTALAQIQLLALNKRYRRMAAYARGVLRAVARTREIEVEQLEDRVVPSLGFSARGLLPLDFGLRRFHGRVDGRLKPYLTDAQGARLTQWPECEDADDTAKAEKARESWTRVTEDLKPLASLQLQRLEQAMVTGRTWTVPDFRDCIAGHPLMRVLGTGLVWGVLGSDGRVASTFSLRADGRLTDMQDKATKLPVGALVMIPHPLQLGEALEGWRARFSGLKRGQPFAQLVRKTYLPQDDVGDDLFGLQDAIVETRSVRRLWNLGWSPKRFGVRDIIDVFERAMSSGIVQLIVEDGVMFISTQECSGAKLHVAVGVPEGISDIDFSEVVRELQAIRT
jgi:hypothetical protein